MKITKEQRLQILELVLNHKKTIKKAAEIVGVGSSTARMILRRYESNGTVFEPKTNKPRSELNSRESEHGEEGKTEKLQQYCEEKMNNSSIGSFVYFMVLPPVQPFCYQYTL